MRGFCAVCSYSKNRRCFGKGSRRTDAASVICSQLLGLPPADLSGSPSLVLPYQTNIVYIMLRNDSIYRSVRARPDTGSQIWSKSALKGAIEDEPRMAVWNQQAIEAVLPTLGSIVPEVW